MTTVVAPTCDTRVEAPREAPRAGQEDRRVAAWRSFGTIGFDAYVRWVLEQGRAVS